MGNGSFCVYSTCNGDRVLRLVVLVGVRQDLVMPLQRAAGITGMKHGFYSPALPGVSYLSSCLVPTLLTSCRSDKNLWLQVSWAHPAGNPEPVLLPVQLLGALGNLWELQIISVHWGVNGIQDCFYSVHPGYMIIFKQTVQLLCQYKSAKTLLRQGSWRGVVDQFFLFLLNFILQKSAYTYIFNDMSTNYGARSIPSQ